MSRIDDLIENYSRFVRLPWPNNLAPPQRVWMAVYPPEDERRLRLHLPEFETATKSAGYSWSPINIDNEFEIWMANHEYKDAYFANPKLMQPELLGFFDQLVDRVQTQVASDNDAETITAVVGTASLYGLGDHVKVSGLIEQVQESVQGRLLVFFPGEIEGNSYRLLGAQDGWNYLATPIMATKG